MEDYRLFKKYTLFFRAVLCSQQNLVEDTEVSHVSLITGFLLNFLFVSLLH